MLNLIEFIFITGFVPLILLLQIQKIHSLGTGLPKLNLNPEDAFKYKLEYDAGYKFNYINVAVEETIHLNCIGDKEMEWMFQDFHPQYHTDEDLPPNVEITSNECNGIQCISKLIIADIDVSNVGEYSCHYRDRLNDLNFDDINSIYIYVSDPESYIAAHEIIPLHSQNAFRNHSLNIDCRPANPSVSVLLQKVLKGKSVEIIKVGHEFGVTFSPKTGFFIDSVIDDGFEHYRCVGTYKNVQKTVKIYINFIERNYRSPVIDDSEGDVVFLRSNFSLICELEGKDRRLLNAKRVNLLWKLHNIKDSRVERENGKYVEKHNKFYAQKRLTIYNAKKSDEGDYVCEANQEPTKKNKFATHFIKVYDYERNADNLHLSFSLNNNITLENMTQTCSVGDDLKLEIVINTIPNDTKLYNKYLRIEWRKDGKSLSKSKKYIIERNNSIASITIIYAKLSNAGLYELFGQYFNLKNASIAINVVVENMTDFYRYIPQMVRERDDTNYQISAQEIVLFVVFGLVGFVLLIVSVILGKKIREERKQKRELLLLSRNLFEKGQIEMINPDIPIDEQIELLPYDHRWEFPREKLILGQILGQGAFGRVVIAEAIDIEPDSSSISCSKTTVAVKMLKERADMSQRKALLAELKILIHVGHHINIVNLLGAVTKDLIKGDLLLVVEYCRYGNLHTFLLAHRGAFVDQLNRETGQIDSTITQTWGQSKKINNKKHESSNYQNLDLIKEIPVHGRQVSSSNLISYSFQCAKGMEYLATKKLIHRDLAARNVLLSDDDVVKICDFGLARNTCNYDTYVRSGDAGPLPVKWMAIESIRDKVFNTKSDVWSYGVLLWEIFTLGSNPYPGFEVDEQFYNKLLEGYRMDKPEFSPESVYEIMQDCWQYEPQYRPDFTSIANKFGAMLEETVKQNYIHQLKLYELKNSQKFNNNDQNMVNDKEISDYLDMNSNGSRQSKIRIIDSESVIYDNVKNVRPIYNNLPTNSVPMEVVPMINL